MRVVFIDIETGGLEPQRPIIQVAAIATQADFSPLAEFEAKIRFDVDRCNPEALEANSYDAELWDREARRGAQVRDELASFLGEYSDVEQVSRRRRVFHTARLAGHNLATFDLPRLRDWFQTPGEWFPASFLGLDTLQLAMWYFHLAGDAPANYQLPTLCAAMDIPLDGAHDALADVRATVELAKVICEQLRGTA